MRHHTWAPDFFGGGGKFVENPIFDGQCLRVFETPFYTKMSFKILKISNSQKGFLPSATFYFSTRLEQQYTKTAVLRIF
jgi:hypothetical protein